MIARHCDAHGRCLVSVHRRQRRRARGRSSSLALGLKAPSQLPLVCGATGTNNLKAFAPTLRRVLLATLMERAPIQHAAGD